MPEPDMDLIRDPETDRDAFGEPVRTRSTGPWPLVVILLAIAALVGGYFFVQSRRASAPAATAEAAPPPAPPAPLGGNPFPADVPPLDMSDPFVRQWLPRLSAHPKIAAWLASNGLIRNFVVVVSNISEGGTPAGRLRVLKPSGTFQVIERGGHLQIDPKSYARYDDLAEALNSIDRQGSAQLYATLKPRIEEANAELGGAPGSFDRTLEKAIVVLLQTPVRDGPIAVEPGGIGYHYADANFQDLNGAQKHLLRMGPANARLIQQSLRELAQALGVPADRLPPR